LDFETHVTDSAARLKERKRTTTRVLALTTLFVGTALFPIALALALDLFVAIERIAAAPAAIIAAGAFFALAMLCWYGLAWTLKRKKQPMTQAPAKPTPLETQVDQLLTEARIIIPGAQALLGFQLTVTLTEAFADLSSGAKMTHAAALCCIGLAVVLLMATASIHRISFGGQDDADFLKIGSLLVVAAPLPLAVGISLDTYVAAGRALQSDTAALLLAAAALMSFRLCAALIRSSFGCLFCLHPVLIARVTRRFAFVGSSFYRCAAVRDQAAWWSRERSASLRASISRTSSANFCNVARSQAL
jgi:hypothetical protein